MFAVVGIILTIFATETFGKGLKETLDDDDDDLMDGFENDSLAIGDNLTNKL